MQILVRSPNWLGDAVMAFPALRALRQAFPEAHVSVITRQYLAPLWELNSDIDELLVVKGNKFQEIFMAFKLRPKKPSVFIIFPTSFLTALCAKIAGPSTIIGFDTEMRSCLLTHPIPFNLVNHEHRIKKYLRLLSPLGVRSVIFSPISLPKEMISCAESLMDNENNSGLIAFNPGAFYGEAKCWPPDRFIELGKILGNNGFKIVILGTEKDSIRNAKIAAGISKNVIDLSGKTSLKELAGILRVVDCLVSNDTGTMHLACLLGTPIVAIFGSTDPSITGPWMGNYEVIRHQVPCAPCFARHCPRKSLECFKRISAEEVATKVLKIVGRKRNEDIYIHIDIQQ